MNENKSNGRHTFGKGYYIALILCAAAIGITGYLYYRNANQEKPQMQDEYEQDAPAWNSEPQKKPSVSPTAPSAKPTTPATAPAKKLLKTVSPVAGETINGYAMDCLSYNETTRDWRTHNGIDIAAESGTKVVAAADGIVYTVCEDDSLGTTVVIRHDGGYTTQYSSLAKDPGVKNGDAVKMGQTIGCVGETALIENTLGPHVHFSVTYQDEAMNPVDFLNQK